MVGRSTKSDIPVVGLVDRGRDAKRRPLAVSVLNALRVGDCDAHRRLSMADLARRGRGERGAKIETGSVSVSVSTNANGE
jgi:hypothetical protein